MKTIRDVMTGNVKLVGPTQTIREAAQLMASGDIGSLPVGEDDRLVGMVTDRDLALRAIAHGLGHDTLVRDVMTTSVKYCHDHENVEQVAQNMAELGVRRLPVVDREKRLVGIVALSNIAQSGDSKAANSLLDGVAQPH
jgi:CBS domain-containing protein